MLKWFKKTWFLILLLVLFISSRSDRLSFRYEHGIVLQELKVIETKPISFEQIADGLHYLQIGNDPAKPYVVFVHGSPGSLWDYGPYLKDSQLSKMANLVSVDRAGFGFSEFGKAELSLQKHADQLKDVLLNLHNEKIILVGHSYGGPILAKATMTYPTLVKGQIFIAPSISPEHEPPNGWRKAANFPLLRWFTPPALKACNQEIIPLKDELLQMEQDWSKIMSPTTIIQGTLDKLVPMENATWGKKAMPQNPYVKLVLLEKENHFILWTRSEVVKREIISLCESLEKVEWTQITNL